MLVVALALLFENLVRSYKVHLTKLNVFYLKKKKILHFTARYFTCYRFTKNATSGKSGKNEKHNCRSVFKGHADAGNLQKNDEAIQIPRERGKCQLNSNREEKQRLSSCRGLTGEADKYVDGTGISIFLFDIQTTGV